MPDVITSYRELQKKLEDIAPRLSHRMRAAIAAACAERGFAALEQHRPVPMSLAESALELCWSFALGEDVSRDEHKWALHELEEAEDAAELDGSESSVVRLLCYALHGLELHRSEHALNWSIGALADGVGRSGAYDDTLEIEEYRWAARTLDLALVTADSVITRDMFDDPTCTPPRWVVCRVEGVEPDDADLEAITEDLRADLRERAEARSARVREARQRARPRAWREPTGIPERYVVREVGRGPSGSEGVLATPGHKHYGLFDAGSGAVLFAPPNTVALGMAPDERTMFAWRVERRSDGSGVARGHYDWTLDRYAWPEPRLVDSYVIQSRETIEWCWPVRLDVPLEGRGRLVALRCRSEDFVECVYVVAKGDGSFDETKDREQAFAWLEAADLSN